MKPYSTGMLEFVTSGTLLSRRVRISAWTLILLSTVFRTAVSQEIGHVPISSLDFCSVDSVTDGDTLRCGGVPIRLLLIDAPEMDQGQWGEVAKDALQSLVAVGTRLYLEYDLERKDRYGRKLAYLYLEDGRLVNKELLRMGVALVSVYPPNVKYVDQFREVQEEAVRREVGLWKFDAFSCTPADHRAGKCPSFHSVSEEVLSSSLDGWIFHIVWHGLL